MTIIIIIIIELLVGNRCSLLARSFQRKRGCGKGLSLRSDRLDQPGARLCFHRNHLGRRRNRGSGDRRALLAARHKVSRHFRRISLLRVVPVLAAVSRRRSRCSRRIHRRPVPFVRVQKIQSSSSSSSYSLFISRKDLLPFLLLSLQPLSKRRRQFTQKTTQQQVHRKI